MKKSNLTTVVVNGVTRTATVVYGAGVKAVSYSRETEVLTITFVNGSIYEYEGVTRGEREAMVASEKPTTYFNQNIKPSKRCTKVG